MEEDESTRGVEFYDLGKERQKYFKIPNKGKKIKFILRLDL